MPAEAALLTVYALLLLGMAHGLRALGRRSTSPYASRTLAGHLRATGTAPEVRVDDWPHNEVPRLYAGMSLTAALAATVVSAAGLVLHHDSVAAAVLLVVITLSALTALRLGGALRRLGSPPGSSTVEQLTVQDGAPGAPAGESGSTDTRVPGPA